MKWVLIILGLILVVLVGNLLLLGRGPAGGSRRDRPRENTKAHGE